MDIATLRSVPFGSPPDVPGGEGVYFVLDADGRVLYIGSTWGLHSRWRGHNKQSQCEEAGAVRIAWFNCPWREAEIIEADLIFEMQPVLNVRGKRNRLQPGKRQLSEVRTALDMDQPPAPPHP